MFIRELWSQADERSLLDFERSLKTGDMAGALFAIEGAAEAEDKRCRALLERWSERASNYYHRGRVESPVEALRWVLVDELDFRGERAGGTTVGASYLSHVVRSRRGLPILLSSVWMIVGRVAGFQVDGVGLPGHFIVRVTPGEGESELIDPFTGGPRLSVADCRRMVREVSAGRLAWEDSFLANAALPDLLERVLRNLCNTFVKTRDADGLYRALRFITTLRPDATDLILSLARMHEELGASEQARSAYELLAERFPESAEGRIAAKRLTTLPATPRARN